MDYCDCDEELVDRTGASISLIFDVEGETGFRDREANLLDELTQRNDLVLATGGGIVLRESNRKILKQRGFVIYLYAPLERLYERTRKDTSRPLLQTENPLESLRAIIDERSPLYEQTADISVDTDERSITQLINYIKRQLSMDVLTVALGERAYDIQIDTGFDNLADKLRTAAASTQFMVVSNDVVAPLYLDALIRQLPDANIKTCILRDGEQYKDLKAIDTVVTALLKQNLIAVVRWSHLAAVSSATSPDSRPRVTSVG